MWMGIFSYLHHCVCVPATIPGLARTKIIFEDFPEGMGTRLLTYQDIEHNVFIYTVFQKKTPTHIVGYKLRNSCLILIIFDTEIPDII